MTLIVSIPHHKQYDVEMTESARGHLKSACN